MGWSGDVRKVGQIWKSEVVDVLKDVQGEFEFKPVELLKVGGDVMV